jgi:hypothetical protein
MIHFIYNFFTKQLNHIIKINFIKLQINMILKFQTNSNMYKSYIYTTNFYGKNYKTSKHTNKLHILYQNSIKINIFKMS